MKEVNGLRIGIFGLLSPDSFLGQKDPRRKGLNIRSPAEVAQTMVKELQPKTDLIVLLSHLGYPKDTELAQAISGIHLIAGSHNGMNLINPPVIKNTVILQTTPRGMYGGRLDLTLYNNEPTFYSIATKRMIENNLSSLKSRLNSPGVPEAEKVQLWKTKEELERRLQQFQGKNEFNNMIVPLNAQMKDDPDIAKMVEAYKSKFLETEKTVPETGKANTPK